MNKSSIGLVLASILLIPVVILTAWAGSQNDACLLPGGQTSPGSGQSGPKVWPMKRGTYTISSPFGPRGGAPHNGTDLAAPIGTPIYAASAGKVAEAGPASGFGNWIIVDFTDENGNPASHVYGHMRAQDLKVKAGDQVAAGQEITAGGNEGQSTGPHLHFEVWTGGTRLAGGSPIDPQEWLGDASEPGEAPPERADYVNVAAVAEARELPATVPEPWRSLINEAAHSHPDSDPRLVAATLWAENRGWPEYKKSDGTTSRSAAVGFWQFIPSTWATLGHDGDGDGIKDPKNPEDSVHAAFKHSPGSAGLPVIYGESGNPAQDYPTKKFYRHDSSKASLLTHMANYNGNDGTAIEGSTLPNFARGQNGDYVRMGYWLMATNFETGWLPESDQLVDARTQRAGSLGTRPPGQQQRSQDCEPGSQNGGSVPGGFVYYSQNDPQWQRDGMPVAAAGCGPTSIAMILATITGEDISPLDVAYYAQEEGAWGGGGGLSWHFFDRIEPKWGVKARSIGTDYAAGTEALKAGKFLVLSGSGGNPPPFCQCSGGHLVAARGITDDGRWIVANPAPNLKGPGGTPEHSEFTTPMPGLIHMWVFE